MAREFPKFSDTKFTYSRSVTIEPNRNGRIDMVALDVFGDPMLYKVICAANGISDVFLNRATVRPVEESVRTELELRGYSGAELDEKVKETMDTIQLGDKDWLGFNNFNDGLITGAERGKMLLLPSTASAIDFTTKMYEDND